MVRVDGGVIGAPPPTPNSSSVAKTCDEEQSTATISARAETMNLRKRFNCKFALMSSSNRRRALATTWPPTSK